MKSMEKENTRKNDQRHEVFDDPMLGAVMLFLYLLQLLNYHMNKQYCTC